MNRGLLIITMLIALGAFITFNPFNLSVVQEISEFVQGLISDQNVPSNGDDKKSDHFRFNPFSRTLVKETYSASQPQINLICATLLKICPDFKRLYPRGCRPRGVDCVCSTYTGGKYFSQTGYKVIEVNEEYLDDDVEETEIGVIKCVPKSYALVDDSGRTATALSEDFEVDEAGKVDDGGQDGAVSQKTIQTMTNCGHLPRLCSGFSGKTCKLLSGSNYCECKTIGADTVYNKKIDGHWPLAMNGRYQMKWEETDGKGGVKCYAAGHAPADT